MLRASAVCESAGFPTASITCEGFIGQAAVTASGMGMPGLPTALVPGHIGTKNATQLRDDILNVTLADVIRHLTELPLPKGQAREPKARDIVARGGFMAINQHFVEHEYSDGLPVIPPTHEAVAEFLMARIGWEPNSVSMGFQAGDNTVTIARYSGGGALSSVSGSTPEELLPYLADTVQRFNNWQITFTTSHGMGTLRPLVIITPMIAAQIAKAGWSKRDVQNYLFEHARRPAYDFERQLRDWNIRGLWSVDDKKIPKVFRESNDPNRLVPIVWRPEDMMIAVGGDPLRNNAYVFAHNGFIGIPTAKKILLPPHWPFG